MDVQEIVVHIPSDEGEVRHVRDLLFNDDEPLADRQSIADAVLSAVRRQLEQPNPTLRRAASPAFVGNTDSTPQRAAKLLRQYARNEPPAAQLNTLQVDLLKLVKLLYRFCTATFENSHTRPNSRASLTFEIFCLRALLQLIDLSGGHAQRKEKELYRQINEAKQAQEKNKTTASIRAIKRHADSAEQEEFVISQLTNADRANYTAAAKRIMPKLKKFAREKRKIAESAGRKYRASTELNLRTVIDWISKHFQANDASASITRT